MNLNWKGIIATFAIMMLMGWVSRYYVENYAYSEFQRFASKSICIPKNSTFTIYLQGGASIHYNGQRQEFIRPATTTTFNGTQGAFVAFCYNQSILKDCICQEAQQEFCGLKQEGFSIG